MALFLILLALALALWPIATWYFADNEPVFAPARPGRVTFKKTLQNIFSDALDLAAPLIAFAARLWRWAAPKLTNPTTWAAVTANAALYLPLIMNDPHVAPLIQELMAKYPWLGLAAALLGLWATRSADAPRHLPPMNGPLVNNAALRGC